MKDIIMLLHTYGEIAHWNMQPVAETCGGNLSCPPIIIWRYKQPSTELAKMFQVAVDSFYGNMLWDLSISYPTWCLTPLRVREYSVLQGDIGLFAAAGKLMVLDPEFGRMANAQLSLLTGHMEYCLKKGKEDSENEKRNEKGVGFVDFRVSLSVGPSLSHSTP
jgi:hypothetical protein